jgi:hypothetical protein
MALMKVPANSRPTIHHRPVGDERGDSAVAAAGAAGNGLRVQVIWHQHKLEPKGVKRKRDP